MQQNEDVHLLTKWYAIVSLGLVLLFLFYEVTFKATAVEGILSNLWHKYFHLFFLFIIKKTPGADSASNQASKQFY